MNTIDVTNTFVPNWFSKGQVEKFVGRSLTDDEWENFLCESGYSWLATAVSELTKEFAVGHFSEDVEE